MNNNAPSKLKNESNSVSKSTTSSTSALQSQLVKQDPGNKFCADCSAPDPDWASINLGILICIKCSGVHRQLGTHISKVRSTTLDTWDKELRILMLALGNTIVNQIFEPHLPPENKINENSPGLVLTNQ